MGRIKRGYELTQQVLGSHERERRCEGRHAGPEAQQPLPTYPGVPQAVDMTLPAPSIFDSPKSLIIILESSSIL